MVTVPKLFCTVPQLPAPVLVVKFSRFGLGLKPQQAGMVVVVVVDVVVVVVVGRVVVVVEVVVVDVVGAVVVVVEVVVVVVGRVVVVVGTVVVVVVDACVVVVVGAPVVVVADGAQGFLLQEPGPMSVPPSWLQWSRVNCAHASWPLSMTQQRVLLAGAD